MAHICTVDATNTYVATISDYKDAPTDEPEFNTASEAWDHLADERVRNNNVTGDDETVRALRDNASRSRVEEQLPNSEPYNVIIGPVCDNDGLVYTVDVIIN